MQEELKSLIDKINEEAVLGAEAKAKSIEGEARAKAMQIIDNAKRESRDMIEEAKKEIAGIKTSAEASIKQSGRDLILSLRKEINAILDRIAKIHAANALTTEEMARIIASLVKNCRQNEKGGVEISLKKEDLEKIEKTLLAELHEESKKGITLKASDDIHAGFIISYDKGKSHYDFTDEAIAKYLSEYLRPKLKELLKG